MQQFHGHTLTAFDQDMAELRGLITDMGAFAHFGDQLAKTAKILVEGGEGMGACGRHFMLLLSHNGL